MHPQREFGCGSPTSCQGPWWDHWDVIGGVEAAFFVFSLFPFSLVLFPVFFFSFVFLVFPLF